MTVRNIVMSVVIAATTVASAVTIAVHAADSTPCSDSSRACVIATANTYIQGLVSHDGSKVPLAGNARRTENGMVTGTSGPGIANDLGTNSGDKAVYDARDIRWFVDGDQATAYYLRDTSTPGSTSPHTATVHLSERFKVDNGLISEIEAIFWINPGPTPDSDCWSTSC
jgi:hypothetical protein